MLATTEPAPPAGALDRCARCRVDCAIVFLRKIRAVRQSGCSGVVENTQLSHPFDGLRACHEELEGASSESFASVTPNEAKGLLIVLRVNCEKGLPTRAESRGGDSSLRS
jgi:hypothetical protein